ncbi:DUF1932 domain-containing protein [Oceanobacillus bengalensis]|uniref:NAD(P)-dependent oxidoreductase n=1 Tax=Oceanobacillus bengalensis TaxID=1435466 RepID=A0A494YZE8_9BACI|nr:DUF1932 domain-containing protein [Oceanobacillus bengalensis]RKQ15538.1 NAD(P)-dependent oxidoreductase [Oceanobacillus bengalensis]
MNISFIGYGEAAFEMSKGLKQVGVKAIVAYDHMINDPNFQTILYERARKASVDLSESIKDTVKSADVLFVAVPADKAAEVSLVVKDYLPDGVLYVDVSASTPSTQKTIATNLSETVLFVDASMLGPLTKYQHRVPMLVSGNGADSFISYMSNYGMNITKVSDKPGDASSIKLIRSIFMKGLATISFETFEIARELNVEDYVLASLSETIENSSLEDTINQLITGTSIHAERRTKELEGSIEMLDSLNINSTLSNAIREKLMFVTEQNLKEQFNGERPKDWVTVIDTMKQKQGS